MPTQINLDGVVPRGELTLARDEHPDERAARLRQEDRVAIKTMRRCSHLRGPVPFPCRHGRCLRVFYFVCFSSPAGNSEMVAVASGGDYERHGFLHGRAQSRKVNSMRRPEAEVLASSRSQSLRRIAEATGHRLIVDLPPIKSPR